MRTSDLGLTQFSLTWIPGSLGEGEPERATVVHPYSSSDRPSPFFPFSLPSYLCTEVARSCHVVSPSAGTGRSPRVQPCLWCCWFWVEQLALASPPEPLNWLFHFPLLHMLSTFPVWHPAVPHALNASGLICEGVVASRCCTRLQRDRSDCFQLMREPEFMRWLELAPARIDELCGHTSSLALHV